MKSRYKKPGNTRSKQLVTIFILIIFLIGILGQATAEIEPEEIGSSPGRFNSIVSMDIDEDGRHEIVFGNYDGYLTIIENIGGDFVLEWRSKNLGTRLWGVEIFDVDNDGELEIFAGSGEGAIYAFGAKSHKLEWSYEGMIRDAHGIEIADLENDGTYEIIVGTGYKMDNPFGTIYIFHYGDSDPISKIGPFDSRLRGIDVADVDNDGTNELIIGSGVALGEQPGEGYIRIFDAITKNLEWQSPDLGGDATAVEVVDIDDDGILDIIVGNGYRYHEGWLRIINYDPSTQDYQEIWRSKDIGPKPYGLSVADIDNDGVIEFVVGNEAGYVYIFDSRSKNIEWKSELLGNDVLGIAIDDVDLDGVPEIIAAQGGYTGKGDFTSGYTDPHIYIIDGKTHDIEIIIGTTNYVTWTYQILILILIIVLLIQLNVYTKMYRGGAKSRTKSS
jgi:WD40 repeat protein